MHKQASHSYGTHEAPLVHTLFFSFWEDSCTGSGFSKLSLFKQSMKFVNAIHNVLLDIAVFYSVNFNQYLFRR